MSFRSLLTGMVPAPRADFAQVPWKGGVCILVI